MFYKAIILILTTEAGPRSFLSFSSQPGVVWINSKVKSTEFSHVATRMITEMARMLKMSRTPSAAREPEPPAEVQRQYTKGDRLDSYVLRSVLIFHTDDIANSSLL